MEIQRLELNASLMSSSTSSSLVVSKPTCWSRCQGLGRGLLLILVLKQRSWLETKIQQQISYGKCAHRRVQKNCANSLPESLFG